METAGCPFVGSGHGSGNAAVFPERNAAKYPVEIAANAENADAGNTGAVTWTKTEDDGLVWTLYDNGALTISGTGAMRDYAYNDKSPVYGNANITSLVIEDGVTRIGKNMCWGCSGLVDVMIPDSVTEIGSFFICLLQQFARRYNSGKCRYHRNFCLSKLHEFGACDNPKQCKKYRNFRISDVYGLNKHHNSGECYGYRGRCIYMVQQFSQR